jgi:DNA (cytosine-5)-methyltransferase 1
LKYLSVCSGIEAATVAWHPLGWEAVAYSEIERFPSEVLAHHYPNTPNVGDMTKFKEWTNVSDVDLLVGGTPCQSFSVAGLRKGLDDPRGNLMLTYLAIAKQYRPNWLVWENVPGVLSSNGGLDFASLLRGMGELGYGFAYRVLDAQYFGVAQRRRRVFVVGYLGDWRAAAAVLFERHSLSGHPAPSREKRESVAASVREGASVGSLSARTGQSISVQDAAQGHLLSTWPAEISSTLDTTFGTKMGLENQHVNAGCPMFVPAQPIALAENTIGRQPQNGGNGDGFTDGGPMYTLNATGVHGVAQPIPFGVSEKPDVGHCLRSGASRADKHESTTYVAQPIAFSGQMSNPQTDVDMTQTLQAKNPMAVMQPIAYAFDSLSSNSMKSTNPISGCNEVDVSKTLDTSRGLDPSCNQGGVGIQQAMAVRRLTPKECERLQGFPDNYTDIQPKGKPTPDGSRYKALGNSMAVPVMRWIGERIKQYEEMA